jgi:hypothetical protein
MMFDPSCALREGGLAGRRGHSRRKPAFPGFQGIGSSKKSIIF